MTHTEAGTKDRETETENMSETQRHTERSRVCVSHRQIETEYCDREKEKDYLRETFRSEREERRKRRGRSELTHRDCVCV